MRSNHYVSKSPSKSLRVIVTGGGTGGHLYPGLAVAEEIIKRTNSEVLFVGTKSGLEAQVVPKQGYLFQTVWISGIKRGHILTNILFPIKMITSLFQAMVIIEKFCPRVIFGTGGYVSWPIIMAGILLNKITVIQEQNQQPGLVTRFLAHMVNSVHLSFEETLNSFKKKDNLHVSGNPTSETLDHSSKTEGYRRYQLDPKKVTLFIFGGSQGARGINKTMIPLLPRLMEMQDVQILWATGPRWFQGIRKTTIPWQNRIRVYDYIHHMALAYGISDLIICRAGATTIAEITRIGLPAILIPFPGAASGHQVRNAEVLIHHGAAEMVMEHEILNGKLDNILFSLLTNSRSRQIMARKAKRIGKPNAAHDIVDDILFHAK